MMTVRIIVGEKTTLTCLFYTNKLNYNFSTTSDIQVAKYFIEEDQMNERDLRLLYFWPNPGLIYIHLIT